MIIKQLRAGGEILLAPTHDRVVYLWASERDNSKNQSAVAGNSSENSGASVAEERRYNRSICRVNS
jgi:hypothetical protein